MESSTSSKRAKTAKSSAPLSTTSSDLTSSSENPSPKDDVETSLHQQLASRTEECHHLVKRLDDLEEVTTKILSCQMQMQENILKVTTNPFPLEVFFNIQIILTLIAVSKLNYYSRYVG